MTKEVASIIAMSLAGLSLLIAVTANTIAYIALSRGFRDSRSPKKGEDGKGDGRKADNDGKHVGD